jgi:hypothetical protein
VDAEQDGAADHAGDALEGAGEVGGLGWSGVVDAFGEFLGDCGAEVDHGCEHTLVVGGVWLGDFGGGVGVGHGGS